MEQLEKSWDLQMAVCLEGIMGFGEG